MKGRQITSCSISNTKAYCSYERYQNFKKNDLSVNDDLKQEAETSDVGDDVCDPYRFFF